MLMLMLMSLQEAKQALELMGRWEMIDVCDALELLSPVFESEEVGACEICGLCLINLSMSHRKKCKALYMAMNTSMLVQLVINFI